MRHVCSGSFSPFCLHTLSSVPIHSFSNARPALSTAATPDCVPCEHLRKTLNTQTSFPYLQYIRRDRLLVAVATEDNKSLSQQLPFELVSFLHSN